MISLERDYHSHLMPGVDDGSRGAAETVRMARGLSELGIASVCLTPHQFRFGNDLAEEEIQQGTERVRELLAGAGIPLQVVPGAEYLFGDRLLHAVAGGRELITFRSGEEDCILVELPTHLPVVGVARLAAALLDRGVRPVMAHPERAVTFCGSPSRLKRWKEAGWWFQLNLPSLVGGYGPEPQALARFLLGRAWYELGGSDLHRPGDLAELRHAHEAFDCVAPRGTMA